MTMPRAFADPDLTPDNFRQFSKQEVDADTAAKAEDQYQPVPTARTTDPMDLASVLGAAAVAKIQKAGEIVFHTAGDSGGIEKPEFQFAVADAMAKDERPDPEKVEELFLWAVGHKPSAKQLEIGLGYLSKAKTKKIGYEDVVWALLNSKEFYFNK